jgi:sarcosine oxidase subunit delta
LLIPCPCCGARDVREFAYGGDAAVARPAIDDLDLEAWHRYLHERRNPRGMHEELWQHVGGCRCWLRVRRDTLTHDIEGALLVGAWGKAG